MFFASLLAFGVAVFGSFVLMTIVFVGLASLGKQAPVVQDSSVLVYNLASNVQDRPVGMTGREFIDEAMGQAGSGSLSLRSVTRAIRAAGEDKRIKALLLQGSVSPQGYGSGFAALKEVRAAIEDFKESGKPVWAYVVYPSARDLYLVSAADTVLMNPEGMLGDSGMVMSTPFFSSFLDKYGVGVQVTRAGEYKAAAESFVRDDMSAPSREANQAYLDDLWSDYLATITEGASVDAAGFEALLNKEGLITAAQALEVGLVDELAFAERLLELAHEQVPSEEDGLAFRSVSLDGYLQATVVPEYSSSGYVAVVYAEGSIVDGEGNEDQVGGARIAREIRRARLDDDAKAIVLRVNSPGGSALASEMIQHEMRLAKERMPVVVSMGTLAASGGYWISAYSDRIFAQPNTLTGSIGVIGGILDMRGLYKELADKHGVAFDSVQTTKFADTMSVYRPKTDEEMAIVQKQVDIIYDSFLSKVAEGRGLELERVREIAQGRIWSGADALEIGLVDELGGLQEAIAYAGDKAGLGATPSVKELPAAKDFLEELMKNLSTQSAGLNGRLLEPLGRVYEDVSGLASVFNDPRGVYAISPYALKID